MPPREGIYGLLAEFNTPGELVHATEEARRVGYRRMECYTPYPVEEAAVALRLPQDARSAGVSIGGIMGVTTAFLMETWINVWAYPLNIAGRPLFSWPAFIIPAYEWTILFSGFSAASGCWCSTVCRSFIILSSTRPIFATVRQRTSSSFVWRQPIPCFRLAKHGSFLSSSLRFPWWRWIINMQVKQIVPARRRCHGSSCLRCLRLAAGRTCRTSQSFSRSAARASMLMAAPCVRRSRTR